MSTAGWFVFAVLCLALGLLLWFAAGIGAQYDDDSDDCDDFSAFE